MKKYYDTDYVETAFKQKNVVPDLWSVRVYIRTHIEGHVKVSYLACAIPSYLV